MIDHAALEHAEFAAFIDFYRAAPDEVRAAHAVGVQELAGTTCLTSRGMEPAAIFRRAVGLGLLHAATEIELEDVLACMKSRTTSYVVTVAPHSQPAALTSWLEKRGFKRGYAWMKFCRACNGAPRAGSDLEIRVVGRELGGEFGRVVAEGFGLPRSVIPWIASLAGRPNWICVMAFAHAGAVAAGAVYVNGAYAWLGLGTTLPSHRRLGAQTALLARRLDEAAARGAKVAVTETGESLPDKPSGSYRNILRAGFEEMYLRQNYVSPPTQ
jgi:GNAT superfamily N-acetyltransferase